MVAEEKPPGTIYIIPARLEDCKVPQSLQKYHWVNLFEDRGFRILMRALTKRAESLGFSLEPPNVADHGVARTGTSNSERAAAKKDLIRFVFDNPKFRWRSVEAVARATGLKKNETADLLRDMADTGEVKFTSTKGQIVAGLTGPRRLVAKTHHKNTGRVAGIYTPQSVIAKLWKALSDGKPHSKTELMANLAVKSPGNRCYWIRRDGVRHNKKNQTHSWKVREQNGMVQARRISGREVCLTGFSSSIPMVLLAWSLMDWRL